MKAIPASASPCFQRGAYAIEFAVVFLIFFAVLYAVICYGMLFAFRLGLQNAAEDGARAALQYQSTIDGRKNRAVNVAISKSNWMPQVVKPVVSAQICRAEGSNECTPLTCGPAWSQRCQIEVLVQANNLESLLPPMPSFAVPSQIAGKASMLLDLR
ncbi:TadE/TadG family type IV pilus assembly protein [Variovorax boronicumulans]|uniref:TadE/TadG family type IV pilus assembly protein n=1 Tax=Variovorax boronicumulans TaxID=436515 RepID=UPI0013301DFD|nr:TadE/TadG family type IV pilus assembly protein [Variovorax boronicumulans]